MRSPWLPLCVVLGACVYEPPPAEPLPAPPNGDTPGGGPTFLASTNTTGTGVVDATIASDVAATYVLVASAKPYGPITGVVGLGATWTRIADQCGARSQTGVSMFVGTGATTDEPILATIDSDGNAAIVVAAYRGVSSVGAIAVHNAVDPSVCDADDDALDASSYALPSTRMTVGAVATRQRIHTPGPGLVQRAQVFAEGDGDSGSTAGIALIDGRAAAFAGSLESAIDLAVVTIELN